MQLNCWLMPTDNQGIYHLQLEFPEQQRQVLLGKTDLSPETAFTLLQGTTTLQTILNLLDQFDEKKSREYTDEAGMYDIGRFLYRATLGKYAGPELDEEAVDLRIISTCGHIHRLPWNMLARESDIRFLHQADWQISLAHQYETQAVELPGLPSLLVFSPPEIHDGHYGATGRDKHIRELQAALMDEIPSYKNSDLFKEVKTRQELERVLSRKHFDVFYYYGHGEGDDQTSRLRLQAGTDDKPGVMSLSHLRDTLQNAVNGSPQLCYINACMSASGGKMGAGYQLGQVCAAVVANRTEAWVSVAQRQGLDFLRHTLLDALPPHEALHRTVSGRYEDIGDLAWATPSLTRHYSQWRCERKPNLHHLNRQDKDWSVKLDRTKQSGELREHMDAIFSNNVDTLCCLWHGAREAAVDLLHDRVCHTVPDNIDLIPCEMDWEADMPGDIQTRLFRASLLAGFQCTHYAAPASIEAIPRFLKDISLHGGSHRIIFHLRLGKVRPQQNDWATPDNLAHFLNWWQQVVAPELKKAHIPTIITMGYELSTNAHEWLEKQYRKHLKKLSQGSLMVILLPPLQPVSEDDMYYFIQRFGLPIPAHVAEREVPSIALATKGAYQDTLNRLVSLYERGVMLTDVSHDRDEDDDDCPPPEDSP